MHKIEIHRRNVLRLGIEGQVGIERIARLEHEKLPRSDMGSGLDCVMVPIEAVRIVFAVLAGFRNDHRSRKFNIAGIGPGESQTTNNDQRSPA